MCLVQMCITSCSGYYGADCSLSTGPDGTPQLLAGLGYQVRARKPHIYIYELPPQFNTWCVGGRVLEPALPTVLRSGDGHLTNHSFCKRVAIFTYQCFRLHAGRLTVM